MGARHSQKFQRYRPINNWNSILKRKLTPPGQSISKIDYSANFASFLNENEKGKPWAFWFGTSEPHRGYEKGIGQKDGENSPISIGFPNFGQITISS